MGSPRAFDARVFAPALALVLGACGGSEGPASATDGAPCGEPATPGVPFGTHCNQLVDEHGRVAFLRGVNARVDGLFDVSFDDGRAPLETIPAFAAADAEAMRDFGFDALRLPINWSALEPTKDGGFDESYLDRVASAVDLAAGAGLSVLLDLHQDAFSKEIGEDGAPLWAIVPPPTALLGGPLTDLEARRLSPQVLAAFDTFFGDGSDGSLLRTRFTAAAVHVMQRFAAHPAVIGLEIFNEPQATAEGVARLNSEAYPALRAAAKQKLYLFEPPVTRNLTDTALLPDAPLGPMVCYSPHVYTLAFVGTDAQHQAMTKQTLENSNANARDEADAWHAPLVITEWGYDPKGVKANDYFTWQSELQEQYLASSFFWLWKEQSQGNWGCFDFDAATSTFSERAATKRALARVRASRVAGWPTGQSFDRASGVFELAFTGNPRVSGDHEIAVAPLLGPPLAVECDGKAASAEPLDHGVFRVRCGRGDTRAHTLELTVAPAP